MRHLFEGRTTPFGRTYARSMCGKRIIGGDPVRVTRLQDPAEPVCRECAAVQARRLAKSAREIRHG